MVKRLLYFFGLAVIVMTNTAFYMPAAIDREYELKAAFVYRFTDYVDWGANNREGSFTIGVLGTSDIAEPLQQIAREKKIKDKKISILQYEDVNDVGPCYVLFVSRNYKMDIETVTTKMAQRPVLIIAEQASALQKGAHINFTVSGNRLKFEVNLTGAQKAGLKIGSQLLEHATQVI